MFVYLYTSSDLIINTVLVTMGYDFHHLNERTDERTNKQKDDGRTNKQSKGQINKQTSVLTSVLPRLYFEDLHKAT